MQSQAIGEFAAAHRNSGATLTFTGGKPYSIKLTPKQIDAIADCYEYASVMTLGRHLTLKRQKLLRQEELTRSQIEQLQSR